MRSFGASLVVGLLPCAAAFKSKFSPSSSCGVTLTFPEFVKRYSRDYTAEEYSRHEQIFVQRAAAIESHNCGEAGHGRSWSAGINNLMDWPEESLASLLGRASLVETETEPEPVDLVRVSPPLRAAPDYQSSVPKHFSWWNLSSIRAYTHQGSCGSCWARAAVTAMNAHAELKGKNGDFSLAQIVACAPNPHQCGGTGGCHGATAELAFDYAMRVGLVSEKDMRYPYVGGVSSSDVTLECPSYGHLNESIKEKVTQTTEEWHLHSTGKHLVPRASSMGLRGWIGLPENEEEPIVRALIERGPVKVSVAVGTGWHIYSHGIMDLDGCDKGNALNHAVILFGYGHDDGKQYWHVKNSWGDDWGENGAMRLLRTRTGQQECKWDKYPSHGSGCLGGPPKVWVCGNCGMLYRASLPLFA